MNESNREKLLKEELEKIHQLEKEVKEIENIEKQQLKAEQADLGPSHEKAKKAVTHGEPASRFKELLMKSKFLLIGVFVALVIAVIVLIPTKTIQIIETVEYTELTPHNTTKEEWVSDNSTISEIV
ncbi:hypothetical protein KY312_02045, partial [Candidatus Woesearchaeota archaeon]|nr:hypothetical protein [Candidatus Woesearchaeota archaeon]